ncbi:MAG TPA: AAA family ATPase [Oscillatoriaceae cyanobacterium M33_DOE_052]|uniref:ParA family protein n=1 Tax=Planktothricoides sp. SpSt-374 TaxID=2282167 RepID=A0A7C3ZHB2_9CYAN|nr:AAA family ATPase [Oscillatoriaceae cyanobacterium M33_DOE_052]
MIPSDIRLYTWVDVEEVLLRLEENWPEWLVWASGYWDSLTLGIRAGTQEAAKNWLEDLYNPRWRNESAEGMVGGVIILESINLENPRTLPVVLEETEEEPPKARLIPSLSRPSVLWQQTENQELPPILPSNLPPIVAFHSFKGGVGRTTHALALAQAMIGEKQKVLLVDADMEAPGISWVFERRLPSPLVCFADLLAVAHGDGSPTAENAVKLVADRLKSQGPIDGIYVLPSFRSLERFTNLEIKPEHLLQGAKDPFLLTQILANLGAEVGADVVIVDLRSGMSELAAGLILDPRVHRIFVTTLSGQAISGTEKTLQLVGNRAPSRKDEDPLPALIIAQVPPEPLGSTLVKDVEIQLLEAARLLLGEAEEVESRQFVVTTPFAESLLALPSSWEETVVRLQKAGIVEAVRSLVERLPGKEENPEIPGEAIQNSSLAAQREKLRDLAKQMVYAETTETEDFFATIILKRLAADFSRRMPIAVIVGAKGSGKTYTFRQIVRRENWQVFARDAQAKEVQLEAPICPILESNNLSNAAKQKVQEVRRKTAAALGFGQIQDSSNIRDYIRESCRENLHVGEWRDRWLYIMAWGAGFPVTEISATENRDRHIGRALIQHLLDQKKQLIFAIDGLEDLFQDFATNEKEQIALRALLQEVPEWLGQQPGIPLGILIFVRRDIVLAAVRQNAAQMMALYDNYALKWNREETLRLVAWITNLAGAIPAKIQVESLAGMGETELTEALIPLWGKRLGSEHFKAVFSARYVLTVLSDYKGQIQARDLVRLLHIAAKNSVTDSRWHDRILTPTAIKESLKECSQEKIQEIEQENISLKIIFTKLRSLPEENRQIPFTQETINLSLEEIKTLEDNGVVIREKDEYYITEIFRLGLGFSFTNAGRLKVITLARRAGQKS